MATAFAEGKKLLAESKYDDAVTQFTIALQTTPTSPDYLLQRSTAYQRAKRFQEALDDAEQAIVHATKRAKRELITQGQLRRGIALFNLERYADAKFCLDLVKQRDGKEKSVDLWLAKTETKLKAAGGQADVTIKEIPELKVDEVETSVQPTSTTTAPNSAPVSAEKIRHEWYQSSTTVSISILAKGVPKDKAQIDIQTGALSVAFPIEGTGSDYDLTIDPLFASTAAASSQYKILPSRIEITLVKSTPGQKWSALEGTEMLETKPASIAAAQTISKGPAYPTSSKTGPKNWDAILNDEPGQDDDTGGDDATKFFKQLYKGASADTQRAMLKSYVESNGTALSTNWDEVSKGPVETLPPDGMDAKKWSA